MFNDHDNNFEIFQALRLGLLLAVMFLLKKFLAELAQYKK